MKSILIILLTCIGFSCLSQDTLMHPVHGLGHEKYVLFEDGSFVYSSHLCGHSFYSYGDYKKLIFGYRFNYDTTRCPTRSLISSDSTSTSDTITFLFFSMMDSTTLSVNATATIGGNTFNGEIDTLKVARADLKNDQLTIELFKDAITFAFDEKSTENKIYYESPTFGYSCGINNIKRLKSTKHGYLYKFYVFDEDPEKPWKKQKRIVYHYYM